jgi:hypothetical protein
MNRQNEPTWTDQNTNQFVERMNQAPKQEQNKGTSFDDWAAESLMMGKLCRRALMLIKHKVGADGAVDEHMAQALTTWLQRRGISIYTEHKL